jgi:hypothetical protein
VIEGDKEPNGASYGLQGAAERAAAAGEALEVSAPVGSAPLAGRGGFPPPRDHRFSPFVPDELRSGGRTSGGRTSGGRTSAGRALGGGQGSSAGVRRLQAPLWTDVLAHDQSTAARPPARARALGRARRSRRRRVLLAPRGGEFVYCNRLQSSARAGQGRAGQGRAGQGRGLGPVGGPGVGSRCDPSAGRLMMDTPEASPRSAAGTRSLPLKGSLPRRQSSARAAPEQRRWAGGPPCTRAARLGSASAGSRHGCGRS